MAGTGVEKTAGGFVGWIVGRDEEFEETAAGSVRSIGWSYIVLHTAGSVT